MDRTATCALSHCGFEPDEFSRVGLCVVHMHAAWEDMNALHDAQDKTRGKRASANGKSWVVYYIAMHGWVKIGKTTNIKRRLRSFYALPEQLLAIEPGVGDREAERHREFAALRIKGTELFEMDDRLRAHVELVRETFGDPSRFLD